MAGKTGPAAPKAQGTDKARAGVGAAVHAFDLFLDESGSFGASGAAGARDFASQIAGVLAPRDTFSEADAEAILTAACACAGHACPDVLHATDLYQGVEAWASLSGWQESKAAYRQVASTVLEELAGRRLQPVRLVNSEGVLARNRRDTQTRMTAALVGAIARNLAAESSAPISLRLFPARVTINRTVQIGEEDYAGVLHNELRLALARSDLPLQQWTTEVAQITTAHNSRRLQVCDLVSHASHDGFKPCDKPLKQRFLDLLGGYNVSMAVPLALEQAQRCIATGQLGVGLQLVGERAIVGKQTKAAHRAHALLLGRLLDACMALPPPLARDQLEQLVAWLRMIVEIRRFDGLAEPACRWVIEHVYEALRARTQDPDRFAWLGFAAEAWLLTALNHAGRSVAGEEVSRSMTAKLPALASDWGNTPMVLGALLTMAVHDTDCRQCDQAFGRAMAVADGCAALADTLAARMPGVFSSPVRSELRGKAISTAMQALIHAGLEAPERLAQARRLSDLAMAELDGTDWLARQLQYRSMIEAQAGAWAQARDCLGKSLGCGGSHQEIGRAIAGLDPMRQGFALLHWARIGALAGRTGSAAEAAEFLGSLNGAVAADNAWRRGVIAAWPAQGILFHLAAVAAVHGDLGPVKQSLQAIAAIERHRQSPTTAVIAAGAYAIAAGLALPREPEAAKRLLLGKWGQDALADLLPAWAREAQPLTAISSICTALATILEAAQAKCIGDSDLARQLLHVAGQLVV